MKMKSIAVITAAAAAGYLMAQLAPRAQLIHAAAPRTDETQTIAAAGRVEPASEEIRVSSALDGRLATVPVEEGQKVQRGQVIATLENRDFQARIDIAAASVVESQAALDRLRNGSRTEQRREALATVREAEAVLEAARVERARRNHLLERGAISRAEFDVVDRDHQVALARLEAIRERASLIDQETRPEELRRAEAQLERARATHQEALSMLQKTIIRSPIAAVVLRKHRHSGERADTFIVKLGDCKVLHVRAEIDENDIARIFQGQRAWVRADAFGDKKFRATVVRVSKMLGRKQIRTDEPGERMDAKVLETLLQLEPNTPIPVGMRVDAYLEVEK